MMLYSRKKRQLRSLAGQLSNLLQEEKNYTSYKVKRLISKIRHLLNELRTILGKRELQKALGTVAVLFGLTFSNAVQAQSFGPAQQNPFGLSPTYYVAVPCFADMDGDGDMDLLVGEVYGGIQYFQNTGTSTAPQFAAAANNPFGLGSYYNFLTFPAATDLDGDGDIDILTGHDYGFMLYFENTGNDTLPQFGNALINPFGLDSTSDYAIPAFVDMDGDGDMDLLVGENYGNMQYFENTGTSTAPQFAAAVQNPFGIIATDSIASPAFADTDEDGDQDLWVGEYYGTLQYFENTGTPGNPQFAAPITNAFGVDSGQTYVFPSFADLDDDADMDLLVGEYYGGFRFYLNTSDIGLKDQQPAFTFEVFPNPATDLISLNTSEIVIKVEIIDIKGRVVMSRNNIEEDIPIKNLSKGVYTIKVINRNADVAYSKFKKY